MHAPLTLYYFDSCPYCLRVRRALADLGLEVDLKNVNTDPGAHEELYRATGRGTVPVLRIHEDDRWLPESRDIVQFLYARFGDGRKPPLRVRLDLQRIIVVGVVVLVLVVLALR